MNYLDYPCKYRGMSRLLIQARLNFGNNGVDGLNYGENSDNSAPKGIIQAPLNKYI